MKRTAATEKVTKTKVKVSETKEKECAGKTVAIKHKEKMIKAKTEYKIKCDKKKKQTVKMGMNEKLSKSAKYKEKCLKRSELRAKRLKAWKAQAHRAPQVDEVKCPFENVIPIA